MTWIAQPVDMGPMMEFTTFVRKNAPKEVHVYPPGDLVIHELHKGCPCAPEILASGVISHNSWDKREENEGTGEYLEEVML